MIIKIEKYFYLTAPFSKKFDFIITYLDHDKCYVEILNKVIYGKKLYITKHYNLGLFNYFYLCYDHYQSYDEPETYEVRIRYNYNKVLYNVFIDFNRIEQFNLVKVYSPIRINL